MNPGMTLFSFKKVGHRRSLHYICVCVALSINLLLVLGNMLFLWAFPQVQGGEVSGVSRTVEEMRWWGELQQRGHVSGISGFYFRISLVSQLGLNQSVYFCLINFPQTLALSCRGLHHNYLLQQRYEDILYQLCSCFSFDIEIEIKFNRLIKNNIVIQGLIDIKRDGQRLRELLAVSRDY